MGLLTSWLHPTEKRFHPASHIDWEGLFHAPKTASGVDVTVDSALTYSAYWGCIHVIAETVATLPLILYRRDGRRKERATDNPLYWLLHDDPNPEMTVVEYQEAKLGHALAWGNHYSEIEFNNAGRPIAFWPLRPGDMEPYRNDRRELRYLYKMPNGDDVDFPAWRIHHLRGMGSNGLVGYSPVRMAMEALGLGLGMEEFGARFFGNGARPGGVVEHPGELSDTAYERLKKAFNADHQGLSNSHRVKILEEGMKYEKVGVPPEEAQFLESRNFQAHEIARYFRVPPHKIQLLEHATFSNIEHQSIEFVVDCILPWAIRNEKRLAKDLLNEQERRVFLVKHLLDGLLRGDTESRYTAYNTGIQSGFLTRNEAREFEDLNPLDGLDEPLVPLNMIEADASQMSDAERAQAFEKAWRSRAGWRPPIDDTTEREMRQGETANRRRRLINRQVRLFEDAAGRLVNREVADIRRAVPRYLNRRNREDFAEWLAEFYANLRAVIPDYFQALMLTLAELMTANVADELDEDDIGLTDELRDFIDGYLANFTEVYAVGSEKQLRTLLAEAEDDEEAETLILERMDGWQETKARKTGMEQAFEAANAFVVFTYGALDVAAMVWVGGDCPLCTKMNGTRISVGDAFLQEGDTLEADDEETAPLPIIRTIKHGPIHTGCDCTLIAG